MEKIFTVKSDIGVTTFEPVNKKGVGLFIKGISFQEQSI